MRLQSAKEAYEKDLENSKCNQTVDDEPLNLEDFQEFSRSLRKLISKTTDPETQASICRKLIQKIEVSPTGITIHYHVGKSHFLGLIDEDKKALIDQKEDQKHKKSPVGKNPAGPFHFSKPLEKYKNWAKKNQAVVGSNSLTIGRG